MNKPDTQEELDVWCNYSNMLSPMAYVECEGCGELKSVCVSAYMKKKLNNKPKYEKINNISNSNLCNYTEL